ncbi:MAG: 23S rRNA (pseudouridine(1915)-N(3))-methyltransferase RlmH [Steroidobacteraceae bacterium]
MRARLIAAGTRLPDWLNEGFAGYARRFAGFRLELVEIPLSRRAGDRDIARALAGEGRRMQAAIGPRDYVVALDLNGRAMSTAELARWLERRLTDGRDLAFLIGGPDGLAPELLQRADMKWSLSPLTWPHGLARVMVAEQLYRAHSILHGHPYHRG